MGEIIVVNQSLGWLEIGVMGMPKCLKTPSAFIDRAAFTSLLITLTC